ncbi:MAG: metal ABC transporter substrate-binding protein [Actinomycetota bacterium]
MRRLVIVLASLAMSAASCGGGTDTGAGEPLIAASFYPLAWIAEEISGGAIEVVDLTPTGVEPHDLELSPSQVGMIGQADLVLYMGEGFQPAVEEVIDPEDDSRLDVLEGMDLVEGEGGEQEDGARDPHVWLDPIRLSEIVERTALAMSEAFPDESAELLERAATLGDRLLELDRDFQDGLASCERHEIVTSHGAFGYLAARYGLDQIAISGFSPEAEPSPRRIAEVIDLARAHGVTTIFFETLVSPDIAETIAGEIGVGTAVFEPIETEPEEGDYLDAMVRNLEALRRALGCT